MCLTMTDTIYVSKNKETGKFIHKDKYELLQVDTIEKATHYKSERGALISANHGFPLSLKNGHQNVEVIEITVRYEYA